MKKYKIIIGGQVLLMTKTEIENLDTSLMTDITGMFSLAPDFDGDLSRWDISSVTVCDEMFKNCVHFLINGAPKEWMKDMQDRKFIGQPFDVTDGSV